MKQPQTIGRQLFTMAGLGLFFAGSTGIASPWVLDTNHATIMFQIRHMGLSKVTGSVQATQGTMDLDAIEKNKVSGEISIDPNTISTQNPKRDGHLKSPDFLNVAEYKTIDFKFTQIETKNHKRHLKGDLTLHGVTHPVAFVVDELGAPVPDKSDPKHPQMRRAIAAHTEINRFDFGINWNKMPGAVGKEIHVEVSAELTHPMEMNKEASKSASKERS